MSLSRPWRDLATENARSIVRNSSARPCASPAVARDTGERRLPSPTRLGRHNDSPARPGRRGSGGVLLHRSFHDHPDGSPGTHGTASTRRWLIVTVAQNMRPLFIAFALVLLAGCASLPADFASRMSAATDQYRTITKGMTKEEAVARLGPAAREEENRAVWEIRYDEKNVDSLELAFDDRGHVMTLTRKHSRGRTHPFAFERSYEITR